MADPLVVNNLVVNQTSKLTGIVGIGGNAIAGWASATYGQAYTSGLVRADGGFSEYGRAVNLGSSYDIAYSGAIFSALAGSWMVEAADMVRLRVTRVGRLVFVDFQLVNTSVSTATSHLQMTLPNLSALNGGLGPRQAIQVVNAGAAAELGWAYTNNDGNPNVFLTRNVGNWSVATNNTTIRGGLWYEAGTSSLLADRGPDVLPVAKRKRKA